MKSLTFFLFIVSAGLTSAQIDDPFANHKEPDPNAKPRAAKMISVILEYVELDHSKVSRLVRDSAGKRDLTALRKSLDKMIELKEATLLESSFALMRSGQRINTTTIEEHIYPTEYDPPEIPQEVGGAKDSPGIPSALKTPANPTAFEMRPVGVVMEFDCTLYDGSIVINGACDWTRHLGEYTFVDEDSPHDESKTIKQPWFYTLKTYVATVVKSGETVLVATHKPSDDKSKRILVFVRADIVE